MKAHTPATNTSKAGAQTVNPRGYAGWAFLSAAAGTIAAIAASLGTNEFIGLAVGSTLFFGLIPAFAAGLALLLAIVLSRFVMRWLGTIQRTQKRVYHWLVVLPVAIALGSIVATTGTSARLGSVLRAPVPQSACDVKVAGFTGFLAARWFARFSAASNDIVALAQANRLTNSSDFMVWEQTVNDRFLQSSGRTNLLPNWKPVQFYSRFMKV